MNNVENMVESELIQHLKEGSQQAFDQIYRLYSKRLYAYCLQYVKVEMEAEEIVQDVFVRLWLNRSCIRQEETLRSLLFKMSKYHLINAYRARINSPVYEDYVNYQNNLAVGEERTLEYEEFVEQLKGALKKLPQSQRRVIKMSKLEQLGNKEIAARLGLSEQTVKHQLSLGLKALHKELECILSWLILLFIVN